jgi:hypothetical protein
MSHVLTRKSKRVDLIPGGVKYGVVSEHIDKWIRSVAMHHGNIQYVAAKIMQYS